MIFSEKFHLFKRQIINNYIRLGEINRNNPKTMIIILCEARTGSGLLSNLLNSIDGVYIGGEILNPKVGNGLWKWASKKTTLRHIRLSLKSESCNISGIKLHHNHYAIHNLNTEEIISNFNNCKFVLLYRSNISNQFISSRITKKTRQFGTTNEPIALKEKININTSEFKEYCEKRIKEILQTKKILVSNKVDFLELKYEDFAIKPQECFDKKIFPFLNLKPQLVSSTLKKQNKISKAELIEGFESLEYLINKYSKFNPKNIE